MAPSTTRFSASDLVRQAASRERDAARWEFIFSELFESGVLSLPVLPGHELCLRTDPSRGYGGKSAVAKLCRNRIFPALGAGCSVGIDIDLLPESETIGWLQEFVRLLRERGTSSESGSPDVLLSVTMGHPRLLDILDIVRATRLLPRIAVRFGPPGDAGARQGWQELAHRSHQDRQIQPVPALGIRPLSGLHGLERGQAVMPSSLFEAPPATAWLTLDIDARGLKHSGKIRARLAACLRFADNLIDTLDWPEPSLRLDALLNRRVAIHVSHIGNKLAEQGRIPSASSTFSELQRWLLFVRRCFVHESMLLARRRGPFPELCANELIANLTPCYGVADARALVRNRLLRHRHLLALSPLALFPDPACPGPAHAWLGLIPAIGCADAITMYGGDVRTRLSAGNWSKLLQLTGAVAANSLAVGKSGKYQVN